ncbi:piggyBac transposable element-derived protein 3-like [Photinus pyralis]|uniref:piggyBac transposable element-derived protein 3-like n=1 Tax=Photinus pyralis TaxID=7054 RepID=UPI001267123B|nr:piggyBac transposable element-derived protein 3-like [Photinus pyralis]
MSMLEESNLASESSVVDVFISPPDPSVLTDEDSGDEDEGGSFDNFCARQLDAEAEVVLHQPSGEVRIEERNIELFESMVSEDPEIVASEVIERELEISEVDRDISRKRKKSTSKAAQREKKVERQWTSCDLPVNGAIRSAVAEGKNDTGSFAPSFYSLPLTPLQFFSLFFTSDMLEMIVKETVTYAMQKGTHLELGTDELKVFFGILLVSGYNINPRRRMYWEEADDVQNISISNSMRRNRFDTLMRYIHFNNNLNIDQTDRVCKVRPYLEMLRKKFTEYTVWECETSIDEAMIPYYGRHGLKQHIQGKPIRFGYKAWCWNMKSGYLIDFEIYQGSKGEPNVYRADYGLGGSIVLAFADKLPRSLNGNIWPHCIYVDNFFTSLKVVDRFSELGIGITGTIRANRLQNCPLRNDLKKTSRGSYDMCYCKNSCTFLCRWNDNSVVTLVSNCEGVEPMQQAKRYSFKESKSITINQPKLIKSYNENMGGTDRMDQNVAYYRTSIRSKKWYWPLVIWGLDVAVTNSWVLYRKMTRTLQNQPEMDLLQFRRTIAQGLLASFGRPKTTPGPKKAVSLRVSRDARFDNVGHMIDTQNTRTRCALCHSTTNKKCSKCNVALHQKCFIRFHTPTTTI